MRIGSSFVWLLAILSFVAAGPRSWAQPENIAPAEPYRATVSELSRWIEREIRQKQIPAFSIAVVDKDGVVWAQGFGFEDRELSKPASAQTVYRVGSVSKLLTDIAVIQLVEQGKLSLDADIKDVLPEFRPQTPFEIITLRQLMSHQSGLVREPPVGNYFDPSEPSLRDTVESLNQTTLVYPPGTKTKYSNAAVAVAGRAIERVTGQPFADHIQKALLDPLKMNSSSFLSTNQVRSRLAAADMWSYDGRRFPAPDLQMGALPAGNLYSTVLDLSKFMSAVFNDGMYPGGQILSAERLAEMLEPSSGSDQKRAFGIGFAIGELDGEPTFEHGGAIYGFSTQFTGLPREKLGVIAVASLDVANGWVERIAHESLLAIRKTSRGEPPAQHQSTEPVDRSFARDVAGLYSDGKSMARLTESAGRLVLREGTFDKEIRRLGDRYWIDDVQTFGPEISFGEEQFQLGNRTWNRVDDSVPDAPPQRWLGLIGEYGWDHNTMFIYEHGGQLWTLIEWVFHYPLTEESDNVFSFPGYGLYQDEKVVFTRNTDGYALRAVAADVAFDRRAGLSEGETFRIRPMLPVERLRAIAMAAEPPKEPRDFLPVDLVELTELDPTIKLDVRYATDNNFMGSSFYSEPRAFMQRPAAEAVVAAHQALKNRGFGLLIYDAYRPWFVTKMFWDATPTEMRRFVADPDRGSRHNRGCAVDLTLFELATGEPVVMVSGYDEFSARAYPEYAGGTSRQRWHRQLLRYSMESVGFEVYEYEWWHFDFHQWRDYPVLNLSFDDLSGR